MELKEGGIQRAGLWGGYLKGELNGGGVKTSMEGVGAGRGSWGWEELGKRWMNSLIEELRS